MSQLVDQEGNVITSTRTGSGQAANGGKQWFHTHNLGSFLPFEFDHVTQSTTTTTDTYTYRTGGSGGTVVGTVVVTYTDSTKCTIDTVVRT